MTLDEISVYVYMYVYIYIYIYGSGVCVWIILEQLLQVAFAVEGSSRCCS